MFPVKDSLYILGLVNSKVTDTILKMINPTMNYGAGSIATIPVIVSTEMKNCVAEEAEENVSLSKSDWDSFETSWDFKRHPLI